jgi:hypothetical protein
LVAKIFGKLVVNRSISWFFRAMVGASLAVAAFGCGGIGLGSVTVGDPSVAESDAEGHPDASPSTHYSVAPDAGATSDAGNPAADSVTGSPLCNISAYGCDPDETACVFDDVDGGGVCEVAKDCAKAAVPVESAACRVVEDSNGRGPQSECAPMGMQGAGMSCTQSSDCAAELDCVGDAAGSEGVCRHYCCYATCSGHDSFCDIEPVFGTGTLIPVCAEGKPCTLLGTDCPDGKSCTVVNASTGQTACVTPGSETAGSDCTRGKCGEDLACIDSKCKSICTVDGSYSCPTGETCTPLLALGENIGVCAK